MTHAAKTISWQHHENIVQYRGDSMGVQYTYKRKTSVPTDKNLPNINEFEMEKYSELRSLWTQFIQKIFKTFEDSSKKKKT